MKTKDMPQFTKDDLRDGMVGIDRSGNRYIYLCGRFRNRNGLQYWGDDANLGNDLTSKFDHDLDFMKICTSSADVLSEWFDDEYLETIWKHPEEITEMTIEEIKKALGIEGKLKIKEG